MNITIDNKSFLTMYGGMSYARFFPECFPQILFENSLLIKTYRNNDIYFNKIILIIY